MFSNKEIARYYDVSESQYRIFWNLNKSRSLHYGYWNSNTKNFHEALLNINRILSSKAAITSNDVVLDAGCGVGGSSIWLAKNIGCKVTGISLSEKQVYTATTFAVREEVGHLANFEQRDFTASGYPDETFDVVWAIESVCHAKDKAAFVKEAFRILKKGGRLIMADFFKKDHLQGKDALQIKQWAHGWAVEDFSSEKDFGKVLIDNSFSHTQIEDASQAILPSAKRLYYSFFLGKPLGFFYGLIHPSSTSFGKKNIDTAFLQYVTLKRNLWKYLIISSIKS